jgi:short subunit dehydrogenase-like uncharacterized protein
MSWMIYGANGYTGTLLAEEAVKRGHRPVLAGRSQDKLAPLAERLGLSCVSFSLDDHAAAARALSGHALVLHAAGPFVDTSEAMVRACLAAGTSYLDITGEVPVFERVYRLHDDARRSQVALISGVGFDVVPTDCLARYVVSKLPSASGLEIAFAGASGVTPGTAKSMLDGALAGGLARREGQLVSLPFGKGGRSVRFADRERAVLPIPWGDLASAHRSTGVRNITTYMAFPRQLAKRASKAWPLSAAALPLVRPFLSAAPVRRALQGVIEKRIAGPSESERARGRSQVWASARTSGGQAVEAWLTTVEGYTFTAVAGLLAVERVLADKPVGALTPAQAFGADFVLEVPGTQRFDVLPLRG